VAPKSDQVTAADRLLGRIKNNKFLSVAIVFGAIIIALASFTDAIVKLENFFGWRTKESDDSSSAKKNIRRSVHDIELLSPAEARRRLTIIEGEVAALNAPSAKAVATQELVNIIFDNADTSDRMREIRKSVMAAVIRMNGRDLSQLFAQEQLNGLDLYQVDLSNTNLHNVSFKDCFLIESSFKGAILDGADFTGALIRNANFSDASVVATTFTSADWFNATGFTVSQLQKSKTATLLPCPKDENGMQDFLANNYSYPFERWGYEIQTELRTNWQTYWAPNGLARAVSEWLNR
jgi:uncharacterized protein YjbI with pentapeptide repeats